MAVSAPTSASVPAAEPAAASDFRRQAAEERFIEAMGLAHEEDRLPRIAGRLIGLLILSPEPMRFDHLAERLRVSRASISTNTRLLENMALIQRVTRPGDRRDYFQITEEPGLLLRIVDRYRARQAMAQEMQQAVVPDGEGGSVVADRLDGFIRFYSTLADSLNSFLAETERGSGNSRSGNS